MKLKLEFKSSNGTKLKINMDKKQRNFTSLEKIYFSVQTIYVFIKLAQALVN
ncbi:hypothetical protein [Bacillus paramobilis]|uniref:hypothetical protein n=1 Tax=Bacillus paramobilis TaxID=2817477 RepID=UPI003D1CAB8F